MSVAHNGGLCGPRALRTRVAPCTRALTYERAAGCGGECANNEGKFVPRSH